MRTFEEMWSYSNTIYGSFTESEARAMYDVVSKLPNESVLVEIGSYCGRSSSLLGQIAQDMGHELTCVDSFITGYGEEDVEARFKQAMNRTKVRYQLMQMTSKRASHLFFPREVDFLFIDGDHRYEGCKEDIQLWEKKVKIDGHILFHDYNSSWDGVKQAVNEFIGSTGGKLTFHDSLAAWRREI